MNFREKVQSMSIKEIVLTMINAIENPIINLDFRVFADIRDEICYGCAATNTICKISGINFDNDNIYDRYETIDKEDREFVRIFESSIDSLRLSDFEMYNFHAKVNDFAQIPEKFISHNGYGIFPNGTKIPRLDNETIKDPETLKIWKEFVEML